MTEECRRGHSRYECSSSLSAQANIFWATTGTEPLPTLPSSFYSITSSAGQIRSPYKLSGRWNVPRCLWTHGGLLHCRLRERMPPPHVLEQEPNFDQEPQLPSCPWGSWLDLQMQWPLKHHCSDERRERKRHNSESHGTVCLSSDERSRATLNGRLPLPFLVHTLYHPPGGPF